MEQPTSEERKSGSGRAKPEEAAVSATVKAAFERTSFECLYDSFHEPLMEVISDQGGLIGINKKGELKRFEHNDDTRAIEKELVSLARERKSELLELRLTHYYNEHSGTLNDSLKYILCFYKGVSEYLMGNYDKAEKDYQCCFNLFDGDAQLYYNLGLTFMMQKQYYKAVVMFQWCSRLDPYHPYAVNNLVYILVLLKKNEEAAEACKDAFNVNPVAKNYFRNWAIALLNQKQYHEAVDVIKRAILMEPDCSRNWVVWAEVMKAKGEFATAMSYYRKALDLNDKDDYSRCELSKLKTITDPQVAADFEDFIVELSEKKAGLGRSNREDCNC